MRPEAAEYGDSSATYGKLYASEAEISDQKLVDTLTGDTQAMLILVNSDIRTSPSVNLITLHRMAFSLP